MSNSTIFLDHGRDMLYYVTNWGQGGQHPFIERVGIPLDLITGDEQRAALHPGPVYVMHGWSQPEKPKARLIKQRSAQSKVSYVVYDYSYEAGLGLGAMQELGVKVQSWGLSAQHNLLWSLNSAARAHVGQHRACLWDYYAVDAVYRLSEVSPADQPIAQRVNALNFLAAKLELKPTRLWALYSLWLAGLLEGAQLGLLATMQGLEQHQGLIKDPKFWTWLAANLGARDNVALEVTAQSVSAKGYPYDPSIYLRSTVSYVCETNGPDWGGPDEFITEKTYRPIINRSPFVLQAGSTTLEWLASQGFDIFHRYIGDKNYARHLGGSWGHIPRCVAAAKKLLISCRRQSHELQQSVDHNYHTLVARARNDRARIRQFLGLPPD